jgi:N-acetylmuramic acid 6-phosphate etherase
MVDMVPTNQKLRHRFVRILVQATGADEEASREALSEAGGNVKVALVAMLSGSTVPASKQALEEAGGHVRAALAVLGASGPSESETANASEVSGLSKTATSG